MTKEYGLRVTYEEGADHLTLHGDLDAIAMLAKAFTAPVVINPAHMRLPLMSASVPDATGHS